MSADIAISLRAVSKKYHLYDSVQDRVREALHPLRRKYRRDFWALRDVSLDVPAGATVGILGVNGSGKSTLLQVICSILQPTSGTVAVTGRVAALIELGAGFNPELTGRQNADLNCLIMGLTRLQIRERLRDIEAFADIGEFFDQPVKTYSSGMFMRVAFATAIHVDPDILVIDEALAVGDARFQQKCFRKFRDFQNAGKTILLVTHDRFSVPKFCSEALILNQGRLLTRGEPREVVEAYSALLAGGSAEPAAAPVGERLEASDEADEPGTPAGPGDTASLVKRFLASRDGRDACAENPVYNKHEHRYGFGAAAIIGFLVVAGGGANPGVVSGGGVVEVYVRIRFDKDVALPLVGLCVKTKDGIEVYGTHSGWLLEHLRARTAGEIATYRFAINVPLAAGDWFFDLAVAESQDSMLDAREALFHLQVQRSTPSTGLVSLDARLAEIG